MREVEAASPSPLPTLGVSLPLSPCSREGMEVGEDTRGSLTFTVIMLFTLGASLPSPDPSEGGGREGGGGDTDLVEVGDKGGKLYQWDHQHGMKMTFTALSISAFMTIKLPLMQ